MAFYEKIWKADACADVTDNRMSVLFTPYRCFIKLKCLLV